MLSAARNVLVTGGSRGLGLAICRTLCAAGYAVTAIARSAGEELPRAIAEAGKAGEADALRFVPCDLAEIDALPALVRSIRKDVGPIYGLVNNAGISTDGPLAMTKDADIERVVRLNTLSPMVLTKYVVRAMMADGGGRIVNISSIVASTGYSGLAVYSATKASLAGFTRSLAREVGRMGVNVNAIAPGFVDTDMTEGLSDERREQIIRRSALKRMVSAADVADAVEFLLSDKARSITGTVITVDAGTTA